jgi:predicted transcriptional regulator
MVHSNDNEQFLDAAIELLEEEESGLTAKGKECLSECREAAIKFKSSKKLMEKMVDQLKSSESHRQWEAVYKLAQTMEKEKFLIEAGRAFRAAKCPGEALRCIEGVPIESTNAALEHIGYLA